MNPVELAVQVANTSAFIAADEESLVLQRKSRVSDGAGGWKYSTPSALPAQRARLIPSTSSRAVERRTLDGKIVSPSHVLLGMPDLDVLIGDTFSLWGKPFEVVHVFERRAYEQKAEVILHGP